MKGALIKFLLTVALLAALFYWLDMAALLESARKMRMEHLVLGILLCFAFAAARICKWLMLLRMNDLKAPRAEIVRSMLFALAVGIVTPFRIGEVVAVMPFPTHESRGKSLMVYLFDRVGELSTVLLFTAPASYLLLPAIGKPLAAGLLILSLAMPLALHFRSWRLWLANRMDGKLSPKVKTFVTSDVRAYPVYWLLSCVTYLLNYASLAVFIQGFEPIEQFSSLIVLPVVTLSNLLTITIGGLGVREGLAALLSPAVGLTPEFVAAAFFLSFAFTRALPGLLGLAWFAVSGKRRNATGTAVR